MPTKKAQSLYEKYQFHNRIMHVFMKGISHEESVLQLPFKHNCMNWILGHIVTNRSHVLETVDAAHGWQEEVRALYHQDTQPVTQESPSIKFEKLIAYLDESVELLEAALENVSAEWLDENFTNYRGEKTRYEHIGSFHWHESFHLGQLEILKAFIETKP
ncbi:MAG: DinB family protein [Anaerolineales bacterium]|uniref:DinB family protein n=1 Tax=Candidatus Desulfolinea nitratireducens TaxID=2841698 RepID=A0A8J6NM15_9CHLR|nr:DinB family protein [Candidatus Desulfolinea nitratireducens]MBL6960312.1 DinB family protein [Anaerolineales bacterium]